MRVRAASRLKPKGWYAHRSPKAWISDQMQPNTGSPNVKIAQGGYGHPLGPANQTKRLCATATKDRTTVAKARLAYVCSQARGLLD